MNLGGTDKLGPWLGTGAGNVYGPGMHISGGLMLPENRKNNRVKTLPSLLLCGRLYLYQYS